MEDVIFERDGTRITTARVILGGSTYAVANLTSVRAETDDTIRKAGLIPLVLGMLLILTAKAGLVVLGVAMFVAGALMVWLGKITRVILTSSAGETPGWTSRNQSAALEIASAVNMALARRAA